MAPRSFWVAEVPARRASVVAFVLALATAACGGTKVSAPPTSSAIATPKPVASGGVDGPPKGTVAKPVDISGTKVLATPSIETSKVSHVRRDTASDCMATFRSTTVDVAARAREAATHCSKSVKAKAVGDAVRGTQSAKAAAASHGLKANAKRCYRIYGATAPGIQAASFVVRDSAGDVAAETIAQSSTFAIPESGALCFETADDASVLVGVGRGEGAYGFVTTELD